MTTEGTPTFVPGDVVFGTDPFKEGGDGRPWLLLSNHEGQPFHGEQYIALSLTTRAWLADLLEIDDDTWVHGGTPFESRIVPWAIQSIDHADIDVWQGRVVEEVVTTAIDSFVEYLRG